MQQLPMVTDNSHRPLLTLDNLELVRVTQISRFHECPAAWKASMLGEGENGESQAAKTGTAAHLVIERYLRQEFELEAWPIQEAYLLQEGVTEEECRKVRKYLEGLTVRRMRVLAIEHELTCPMLANAPAVQGHIDCIFADEDGGLTIRDHKTNRRPESAEEWQQKVQPLFYAVMVRQRWPGYSPIRFEIGYVLQGHVLKWETNPDDGFRVFDLYQEFWDAFRVYRRSNEWPERINDNCRFCPIRKGCPTLKRATENFSIAFLKTESRSLPERFRWMKSVLKAMEAEYDALKAELTTQVQAAGGRLEFEDQQFILQSSRRREVSYRALWWKVWEVASELAQNGQREKGAALWDAFNIRLDEIASVRMAAFDKLVEDHPAFREPAQALVQITESDTPTLTVKARRANGTSE